MSISGLPAEARLHGIEGVAVDDTAVPLAVVGERKGVNVCSRVGATSIDSVAINVGPIGDSIVAVRPAEMVW
jgi:hypothetical protein